MIRTHTPTRRLRTLYLRTECACGAWTVCPPPLWQPPDPIPDGHTIPWPGTANTARRDDPTVPLPQRPFLTRGAVWRLNQPRG
jgi:hypothetical protein